VNRALLALAAALLGLACSSAMDDTSGGGSSSGSPSAPQASPDGGASPGPTGDAGAAIPIGTQAELDAWLQSGAYKSWACEAAAHDRRPGSGHSRNRICVNPALGQDKGAGPYPVGAASVKELYDGSGAVNGYAVYVKVKPGAAGDTWFWYERIGSSVVARSEGASLCVGCHSGAPRDHVFTASPQ